MHKDSLASNAPQRARERKYFIVRHDLGSLHDLPGCIWRSDLNHHQTPIGFRQVQEGDRWIAFAYTSGDSHDDKLSTIQGFYECTERCSHRPIRNTDTNTKRLMGKRVWIIRGKRFGPQRGDVAVRPLGQIIDRKMFNQKTIVQITKEEFELIRCEAKHGYVPPNRIPLFGRPPGCEQELLSMVIYHHRKLGIDNIIRVRKAFPDLLVQIGEKVVHLELETSSGKFLSHGHKQSVSGKKFRDDRIPIGVLCWIDDNKSIRKYVHKVFELSSLLRERKKISW